MVKEKTIEKKCGIKRKQGGKGRLKGDFMTSGQAEKATTLSLPLLTSQGWVSASVAHNIDDDQIINSL